MKSKLSDFGFRIAMFLVLILFLLPIYKLTQVKGAIMLNAKTKDKNKGLLLAIILSMTVLALLCLYGNQHILHH